MRSDVANPSVTASQCDLPVPNLKTFAQRFLHLSRLAPSHTYVIAMRLLDTYIGQFVEQDPEKTTYAILSHTWRQREQTYDELKIVQARYRGPSTPHVPAPRPPTLFPTSRGRVAPSGMMTKSRGRSERPAEWHSRLATVTCGSIRAA
ncbi:hypothetical protein BD311DRAFT_754683 [Dichomitus squalens]|uniref:Uncharacterized protein n=1 Tax=Dichomitus squalens TaxID=114155 RepID=A0A4Q9MR84_9APHY|nr:hypothetical protein BD311DRAFT_754683 [Dichomitus squalens]